MKPGERKCASNLCLRVGYFDGLCPKCKDMINNRSISKRMPISKESKRLWPKAFKEAKKTFQLLRRIQEADQNGMVVCVHGKRCSYKRCDAGHYMPAHYKFTCFNKLNVWPQEKNKNLDMQNPITVLEYRNFLIKKIGIAALEKLESTYKIECKYSVIELIEMTKAWNIEIEKIKREKNI